MQYVKIVRRQSTQRGAVSLFVVIFSALIITVMTVSFARIMIDGQRNATNADLSQSAYDSAQAGVEDAKRALIAFNKCAGQSCVDQRTIIDAAKCNTLQALGVVSGDGEVLVEQYDDDKKLQQAYTCVTLKTDSDNYLAKLDVNTTRLIPLRSKASFSQVKVEWFSSTDVTADAPPVAAALDSGSGTPLMPSMASWSPNRPALMRTQLIQTGSNFSLNSFDAMASGKSNTNTLFLYPSSNGLGSTAFSSDHRGDVTDGNSNLKRIKCEEPASGGYACSVIIALPDPIGGDEGQRQNAFLRLNAFYRGSDFKVTLLNASGGIVKFNGVQAIVDSTGRANDQFRRVESRVEFDNAVFPYPEAAVDLAGSLCKAFLITDHPDDYSPMEGCASSS